MGDLRIELQAPVIKDANSVASLKIQLNKEPRDLHHSAG